MAAVTGSDTADYAQSTLFSPLGIARPTWRRSPQGEAAGGFGLALTPRNLAKPGYLVNTLTPFVGDANAQTPEFKSFLVNIERA